jgi:hypothetical protein
VPAWPCGTLGRCRDTSQETDESPGANDVGCTIGRRIAAPIGALVLVLNCSVPRRSAAGEARGMAKREEAANGIHRYHQPRDVRGMRRLR